MHQGLAAWRATGAEFTWAYFLSLLAEAYGKTRQTEQGLTALAEALAFVDKTGERFYEAELYRLKGELLLNDERRMQNNERQTKEEQQETVSIHHSSFIIHRSEEAEACFHKAIEIARKQQAKSLELRATVSLARLWQSQGKRKEAHKLLAEIYNWFTEGRLRGRQRQKQN
jgi:predicted ATPase